MILINLSKLKVTNGIERKTQLDTSQQYKWIKIIKR